MARRGKLFASTAVNAFAPPALVKNLGAAASTGSTSTLVITVPSGGVAIGNRVEVAVIATGTVSGVADDGSNSYAARATQANGSLGLTLWSCRATSALIATNQITVTFSTAQTNVVACAAEFAYLAAVSPVDGSAGTNTGVGTSLDAGSLTTTVAYDLLIAAFAMGSGNPGTQTPAASWTALSGGSVGASRYLGWQYRTIAAVGAVTPTMTIATSRSWTGVSVAYKAA